MDDLGADDDEGIDPADGPGQRLQVPDGLGRAVRWDVTTRVGVDAGYAELGTPPGRFIG